MSCNLNYSLCPVSVPIRTWQPIGGPTKGPDSIRQAKADMRLALRARLCILSLQPGGLVGLRMFTCMWLFCGASRKLFGKSIVASSRVCA
jgi:hypothetical protein